MLSWMVLAGPAWGAGPEDVAVRAEAVFSAQCSNVASRGVSAAAAANTEVSAVWEEVSRSYEATGAPFLRYWRGVLGQCLGHEDRALEDYRGFLEDASSADELAGLRRDARARIRRLDPERSLAPPEQGAGIGAMIGGALAAGVGGVLHGATFEAAGLRRTGGGWETSLDPAAYDGVVARWDGANKAGFGVLLAGASTAVVGAVVLAVSAAHGTPAAVSAAILPTPDGVQAVLGGRF